jgi:hypothetical protein
MKIISKRREAGAQLERVIMNRHIMIKSNIFFISQYPPSNYNRFPALRQFNQLT